MPDPMTPERLAEIEQRFASGRVVNVATQRALLAEVRRLRAAADERDRLAAERDAFIAGIGFTPAADLVELVEPLSKRIGDAVEHRQCAEELAWEKRQHEARMAEVRRLQDVVERVRELHRPVAVYANADECGCGDEDHALIESTQGDSLCWATPTGEVCCCECLDEDGGDVEWPCPTIAALDGES